MNSKISIFVGLLFLMASCSTPSIETTEVNSAQLDGQSIFKTVFFNLGEQADDIPTFKGNVDLLARASEDNPEFMQNYIANVDNYIAQIEEKNPEYFQELSDAVYSQDLLDLKRAMKMGDLLILPTIVHTAMNEIQDESFKRDVAALNIESVDFRSESELEGLSESLLTVISRYEAAAGGDATVNNGRCLWFAAVGVVTLAAVGNFAYLVNVAYEGNLAWQVNWVFAKSSEVYDYDRFSGEQLIKEIAVAFNK